MRYQMFFIMMHYSCSHVITGGKCDNVSLFCGENLICRYKPESKYSYHVGNCLYGGGIETGCCDGLTFEEKVRSEPLEYFKYYIFSVSGIYFITLIVMKYMRKHLSLMEYIMLYIAFVFLPLSICLFFMFASEGGGCESSTCTSGTSNGDKSAVEKAPVPVNPTQQVELVVYK